MPILDIEVVLARAKRFIPELAGELASRGRGVRRSAWDDLGESAGHFRRALRRKPNRPSHRYPPCVRVRPEGEAAAAGRAPAIDAAH